MYLEFAWALFATILYIYYPNYVYEYFIHLLCGPSFALYYKPIFCVLILFLCCLRSVWSISLGDLMAHRHCSLQKYTLKTQKLVCRFALHCKFRPHVHIGDLLNMRRKKSAKSSPNRIALADFNLSPFNIQKKKILP